MALTSWGWSGLGLLAVGIQCLAVAFVGRRLPVVRFHIGGFDVSGLGGSGFGVRSFAFALGAGFAVRLDVGFFGGGSGYCRWVLIVLIACQISLAPRQLTAENGRGSVSGDWFRIAAMPCR